MKTSRRTLLGAGAALPILAAVPIAAVAAVQQNPDAELIRICAQHIVNLRTYNAHYDEVDAENDPLWHTYTETWDAVGEAEPQTIQGMLAKARAAKAEAVSYHGAEHVPDGTPGRWAWDLINDLLRLHGEGRV